MNKLNWLLLVFITFYNLGFAQDIKVNDKKFTTLLFQSNIISGIIGNEDYIFEYNQEEPDTMALLKATKKNPEETSLVIKTENGTIFNINLSFGSEKKNIIVINDTLGIQTKSKTEIKSIVVEQGTETVTNKTVPNSNIKKSVKENDYTIGNTTINDNENLNVECEICASLIKSTKTIKRVYDEVFDVKIQLNDVFYSDSKLYYILNFQNNSAIDYNLNYIKSYVDTKNDNQSASAQYLEKNPILIYNSNRTIPAKSNRIFVFVYEQFSIDNNKKLTFEVNESNGERNLSLKVPHFLINNPNKIKK